jgi:O-antigen/teichoic acid export membrane protein
VFYPNNADNYLPHALALQVMLLTTPLVFAKDVIGMFFNAVERPRLNFFTQAIYTAAVVLVAMPLTAVIGLSGLVWGGLLSALIGLVAGSVMLVRLRRLWRGSGDRPAPAIRSASAADTMERAPAPVPAS